MAPKVEKLLDGFALGEGPHWDHKNQCLYFVDITNSTIHKYVPAKNKHTSAKIGSHNVSLIIPVKNKQNQFLVTLDRSVTLIEWDGESKEVASTKTLYTVEEGTAHVLNDGKCDKHGRLWAGTLSLPNYEDGKGGLYNFSNNSVKTLRQNIKVSNGMAFDFARGKFYYIDSFCYGIDQYDVDFENGTISNHQTIFKLNEDKQFVCDGMTIDTDGNLWVAVFGTASVYKIDPRTGEILQVVKVPAAQTTSVAFGGPNLDELYITTGAIKDRPLGEHPGSLFRVTGLDVKGFPADEAQI